jgi:hypothetical protein
MDRTLSAALLAAALAGCATTQAPPFNRDPHLPSSPPSAVACAAFAIDGPKMILPAPGSTGILTTITVLTFAPLASAGQSISGNATLHGSDGSTITSGPLTPSVDGTQTVASIGGLAAHTTYEVVVAGRLTDGPCSYPFGADDGAFTTL